MNCNKNSSAPNCLICRCLVKGNIFLKTFDRCVLYYTTFLSDLLHSQISNNAYYSHPFREINMIIHESGDNNKNYLPGT